MPYYDLQRVADGKEFNTAAADDGEALLYLSKQTGEHLSFEGDGPPPYLLAKRTEPIGWLDWDTAVYTLAG